MVRKNTCNGYITDHSPQVTILLCGCVSSVNNLLPKQIEELINGGFFDSAILTSAVGWFYRVT